MPCPTEIRRTFTTREDAFRYLASRGFVCAMRGWINGRWAATVVLQRGQYEVTVRLGFDQAA